MSRPPSTRSRRRSRSKAQSSISPAWEGQAAGIQAQLSAIYDELQQAKAERDAAEGEAEAAARALEEKQAEFDAQFASAQSQLRAIQKLQHGGSVTLLSQAGNWFQALTCGRVLDALMGYSSRLLADLDAQARELDAQRLEAEAAAERARAAQERLEASEASLNATSAKLAAALQASNADLSDYQAEAEAAAQLTEVAKRAYQEATAALDNFARQQNEKYSTPDLYCSLNFGPPLASGFRISCYYGAPDGIDGSHHNGTDFAAPGGTPIYAVADGVVSAARSMRSYGKLRADQPRHGRRRQQLRHAVRAYVLDLGGRGPEREQGADHRLCRQHGRRCRA